MSEVIQLREVPERKMHTAHKAVLTHIALFDECLNGRFQEAAASVVDLPDENPLVIDRVLPYLYNGRLQDTEEASDDLKSARRFTGVLMQLFILADKWCMEELGNSLINRWIVHYETWTAYWLDICSLREHGLADCRTRRMVLPQMISDTRHKGWVTYLENCKDQRLRDTSMVSTRPGRASWTYWG